MCIYITWSVQCYYSDICDLELLALKQCKTLHFSILFGYTSFSGICSFLSHIFAHLSFMIICMFGLKEQQSNQSWRIIHQGLFGMLPYALSRHYRLISLHTYPAFQLPWAPKQPLCLQTVLTMLLPIETIHLTFSTEKISLCYHGSSGVTLCGSPP